MDLQKSEKVKKVQDEFFWGQEALGGPASKEGEERVWFLLVQVAHPSFLVFLLFGPSRRFFSGRFEASLERLN